MTDLAPPAERLSEDRVLPAVVYGLYIASVVSFGGTAIVALIIAYARLADAGPRAFSHYRFAIRTFWLSIGWFLIRAVVGLIYLAKGDAYPRPRTWLV